MYSLDYAFGYWIVHSLLDWHPAFTISLEKLFGIGDICIVSFLVGGNVLGIITALVLWPVMNKFFSHLATHYSSEVKP